MAPPGWGTDSESETDTDVPPPDALATFLSDVNAEQAATTAPPPPKQLMQLAQLPPPPSRFAIPMSDKAVEEAKQAAIPKKTKKDTAWCAKIWNDWSSQRNSSSASGEHVPDIANMEITQLQWWMSRFVLEIRKKDGTPYPPESIYHIVCGIMRFVRLNGKPEVDFFRDQAFAEFRTVLDAEMKRLKAAGIGSRAHKAEPLTPEEEEMLWEKGVLGDHSPQALLNTVFYQNGVNFALRSGNEHRQLRYKDCQIQVFERPGERPYLQYVEDVSKNNQGGLRGRKNRSKEVIHHSNEENLFRCPVRLFKLYNKLCPKDRPENAFYLHAAAKEIQRRLLVFCQTTGTQSSRQHG